LAQAAVARASTAAELRASLVAATAVSADVGSDAILSDRRHIELSLLV